MCQATYFELCKQQTSNTPKEEEDDEEEEKKTHTSITEFGCGTLHILLIVIYTRSTFQHVITHLTTKTAVSQFTEK